MYPPRYCKPEIFSLGINGELTSEDGTKRMTLCGTLDCLSPKMVEGNEHNEKVDYWVLDIYL